jgi:hypothetical protein
MTVSLDEYLTNLIAEMDGVRPEAVTVEYIHEQREKRIYPTARYDCSPLLISLTREEFGVLEEWVDRKIKEILSG